jgi:cobalamin-dependent methionine synthase I
VGQWQFRKQKDQTKEEYNNFLQEIVYPILEEWKQRILNDNLLQHQAVYGYFSCQFGFHTSTQPTDVSAIAWVSCQVKSVI